MSPLQNITNPQPLEDYLGLTPGRFKFKLKVVYQEHAWRVYLAIKDTKPSDDPKAPLEFQLGRF